MQVLRENLLVGYHFLVSVFFFGRGGNIKVKQTLSIQAFAYHFYCIQEPSECEPVRCEMFCEHGFAVDENGCEVCECAEVIYFCCYIKNHPKVVSDLPGKIVGFLPVTALTSKCHTFFSIGSLLSLEMYVRQKFSLCLFS